MIATMDTEKTLLIPGNNGVKKSDTLMLAILTPTYKIKLLLVYYVDIHHFLQKYWRKSFQEIMRAVRTPQT